MDRRPEGDGLDAGHRRLDVRAEIGLGQDDNRRRPALPGAGQIALQAARIEIGIERGGQKGGVDIGRHHLGPALPAGGLAHEGGAPWQDMVDDRHPAQRRIGRHPVAHGGIAACLGVSGKSTGYFRTGLPGGGDEAVEAALLDNDASGHQAFGGVRREIALERIAPAIGF